MVDADFRDNEGVLRFHGHAPRVFLNCSVSRWGRVMALPTQTAQAPASRGAVSGLRRINVAFGQHGTAEAGQRPHELDVEGLRQRCGQHVVAAATAPAASSTHDRVATARPPAAWMAAMISAGPAACAAATCSPGPPGPPRCGTRYGRADTGRDVNRGVRKADLVAG